ncbi:YtnP family quorum-quenching lactonase [Priestia abyssalis]|uniref:YtnP family quorum-quenching lactonase n=1 Tax=Priestia abyssalis TaxID=1221450 RepID=UPI000994D01E|nr:MBL fold metallo-hydrolase [Priestia abyssalis]
METLTVGRLKVTWLNGGNNHLDGGAMFGVVPKALWSKRYPANEDNRIELRADPLLIQAEGRNILVETGMGKGRLSEKQLRNFGVTEESSVQICLNQLGISVEDIDTILMTHLHFDHVLGLTSSKGEELFPTFPNAQIIVSKIEWDEMREPNIRSRNTYWKENWQAIAHQVISFSAQYDVTEEIKMIHTGGHSNGHAIIVLESGEEMLLHLADILPTHAHQNPLWVMAYDDYPMTSIEQKQKWIQYGVDHNAWFSFYHDAYYRALKWDAKGEIAEKIERRR